MKKNTLLILLVLASLCVNAQINNSGLEFDGIDDLDSIPNSAELLDGATEMSLTVWVKPLNTAPSYPDFDAFAGYKNEIQSDFYIVQIGTTTVEARFRNTTGTPFDILFNGLVLNEWNHFAFTYDGTKTVLFHNGINVGSKTASGTMGNPGLDFLIGAVVFSNLTAFKLKGSIDEVGLWTSALTPQQVADLMICPPIGSEPSLVGYWDCNEGNGTTTEDRSSGQLSGILLNGTDWIGSGIPEYNCPAVGLEPNFTSGKVTIYPNPFFISTTIQFQNSQNPVVLSLTDAVGKELTSEQLRTFQISGDKILFEKGNLKNGIYLLKITSDNQTFVKKVAIGS